jgi:macrolide transport system ATP-binding/permease protein
MLILQARKIKKYYGDRLIVELEDIKLYKGDRVGIVGLNGCGKTTLINILTKRVEPDEGDVKLYTGFSYIQQREDDAIPQEGLHDGEENLIYKEFNIQGIDESHASGGEKTRLKIVQGLSSENDLLFADEPTCNLDMKGARLLEEKLKGFKGTIVLISHDRVLMDSICRRILEIENGKVKMYEGNYTSYRNQKEAERERQLFEYEQYEKAKDRLEGAMEVVKHKVKTMRKTPTRMGNSEARLHKRGVNGKKAKMDRNVKAMESRKGQLEVKDKPRELPKAKIDIRDDLQLISKVALSVKDISKSFGSRKLFEGVSFDVPNRKKVALIGDNGSGKTTLINMIIEGVNGVKTANGLKIGYFSQNYDILDNDKTILENVLKSSSYPEAFVRTMLARLLFKREDVFKKVGQLSGGERVKVAFAKIFTQDFNLLILDEPTNYLDVYSMESLEEVLAEYEGTVLFVSHDRRFVEKVADRLILLENQKIRIEDHIDRFFISQKVEEDKNENNENSAKYSLEKLMLLENKLAELNGKLCIPNNKYDKEALNDEYENVLQELNILRKSIKAVH